MGETDMEVATVQTRPSNDDDLKLAILERGKTSRKIQTLFFGFLSFVGIGLAIYLFSIDFSYWYMSIIWLVIWIVVAFFTFRDYQKISAAIEQIVSRRNV